MLTSKPLLWAARHGRCFNSEARHAVVRSFGSSGGCRRRAWNSRLAAYSPDHNAAAGTHAALGASTSRQPQQQAAPGRGDGSTSTKAVSLAEPLVVITDEQPAAPWTLPIQRDPAKVALLQQWGREIAVATSPRPYGWEVDFLQAYTTLLWYFDTEVDDGVTSDHEHVRDLADRYLATYTSAPLHRQMVDALREGGREDWLPFIEECVERFVESTVLLKFGPVSCLEEFVEHRMWSGGSAVFALVALGPGDSVDDPYTRYMLLQLAAAIIFMHDIYDWHRDSTEKGQRVLMHDFFDSEDAALTYTLGCWQAAYRLAPPNLRGVLDRGLGWQQSPFYQRLRGGRYSEERSERLNALFGVVRTAINVDRQ